MDFKTLKKATSALMVAAILLLALGLFLDLPLLTGLALAALVAAFALERKFPRCPHCGQYLRELPTEAEKCPKCGEGLHK